MPDNKQYLTGAELDLPSTNDLERALSDQYLTEKGNIPTIQIEKAVEIKEDM